MGSPLTRLAKTTVLATARRVPLIRRVADFVSQNLADHHTYAYVKRRFIQNGDGAAIGTATRERIVERFELIDKSVPSGTSSTDGLLMAEALLSVRAPGHIVECGCFLGASTAKLSIVAALLGRPMHVFDSFDGLPRANDYDRRDHDARKPTTWVSDWNAGNYRGTLETVRRHVSQYGDISVCRFYKGWFDETLVGANVPEHIGFAFTDVDLPSSAKTCLLALWPRLTDGAVYFSHDVAFFKVLETVLDDHVWASLSESRPILFGAGFGMCDASPHLGFFAKGKSATADYVKSLLVDK